ncbi:longitudinals lacking protein, isoforms A/B/D/L-like isoform X5 [Penaeus chinensis]|uniref:longitudinals lacking protein, isoforms A/B/D/L-like isoform X5 n=1 Tax=Penaeus chinensis TaxID=139456 RepID=UPI001FB64AC5|nr:longitudinals lacking protein, isoforms A/B/D/L-like isoform X5 [Penaeus chinensis]
MEELLSLKWNNHRSTFLHILGVLRDKQSYTDVTLACDGKFYSVHKLVLSTCSDYFCAMFEKTACKSPVIVLKDIKCEDLEALLDYMYLGEVNVRQSDLASLIKAAENLRIKGLAVPDDEPPKRVTAPPTRTDSSRREGGSGSPPSKRKRRDEGEDGREDVRPQVSGLHTPPPPSRPKSPNTQRQSPSSHRTPQEQHIAEDHDSRPLSSPAESPAATHTSGHQPSHQPSQSQQLPHQSSHQVSLQPSQQLGEQPTQQPVSNQYRGDESQTFVKVEMEETDDTGDMNQDSYNMSGDGYKEEDSGGDLGGDLSNDLPEFLQQAASGALAGTSASYPHTFAGPSGFQPEVSGWQGDGQSLPGSFGGLGFPPHSSQDNQPGGGGRSGKLGGGEAEALACSVCGKLITGRNRRQRLQYHLSTHSGERPHHCPFCPYRAHHKFTLDRHVRTVHRDHFVLRDAPSTHGVAQTLPSSTVSEGAPPSMGPSITMSGLARLMEDTQGVADHT